MKRDERKQLLSLTSEELRLKVSELSKEMIQARQEKRLQTEAKIDLRRSYKLRKTVKMIKAELTARILGTQGVQE